MTSNQKYYVKPLQKPSKQTYYIETKDILLITEVKDENNALNDQNNLRKFLLSKTRKNSNINPQMKNIYLDILNELDRTISHDASLFRYEICNSHGTKVRNAVVEKHAENHINNSQNGDLFIEHLSKQEGFKNLELFEIKVGDNWEDITITCTIEYS